jgi:hypothetical protein
MILSFSLERLPLARLPERSLGLVEGIGYPAVCAVRRCTDAR